MFIFHPFHFSQFLSCTAQIHLEYLFMFPSIPLFPPFTVIYPLSVSASVSETPIYSNSIPYRTAHSLWNKVFFSIAVQWTADTPAPFLPPPQQHSLQSAPHCPWANLSSLWFWPCWSVSHGFCMFLSKSWLWEGGCLRTAHWADVVMSAV